MIKIITKTLDEWREILPPRVFEITRGQGTEPPFNNFYFDNKREGLYKCSNCNLTLFSSKNKFDSGTGWPSFYKPFHEENVEYNIDKTLGMIRKEAACARCGAHLGHVFTDGPKPTGLRFCINSGALKFVEKKGNK